VTVGTVLKSTYTYNGLEQVTIRLLQNMTPSGTTHFIYDRFGNLIAETAGGGATGPTGTSWRSRASGGRASTSTCRRRKLRRRSAVARSSTGRWLS
jgi:YD repeat-containing protein